MTYQDAINSNFMYLLGAIVATFVLVQSVVFLVRAYKQGIAIGMDKRKLFGAIKSSAIFSIVPSIPIVIGLIAMVKALGRPIAWIRLSVVGSVTYELPVADQAAKAMGMTGLDDPNFTLSIFAGVVLVMSVGIITGLILSIFNGVKIVNKGMNKMGDADKKWGELFVSSLFMGLVATFFGSIVTPPIVGLLKGTMTAYDGMTSIMVLISSALIMLGLSALAKKNEKMKWLEGFALTFSMIVSMGLAILYYVILGGSI